MRSERHVNLNNVLRAPFAQRNLHIGARTAARCHLLAVQLHAEAFRRPIRHAQLHRELATAFDNADFALLSRPLAFLTDCHLLGIPLGCGWEVERHPKRVVTHKISSFLVFHMVLRTCSATAGGLRRLISPRLRRVETHGILIQCGIMLGMEAAHQLVIEQTLVIVHIAGVVRVVAVQVFRQLRQVVGAAGLVNRGLWIEVAAPVARHVRTHRQDLGVRLTEHLAVAHAAHGIAVAALDEVPEVVGQVIVIGVLVAAVAAQGTGHHRDMLVGMAGADGVHVFRQRVEEGR